MANELAYGFVGQDSLFSEKLENVDVEVVRDAIVQSVAEHNRQVRAIMSELAEPTSDYKVRFKMTAGGSLQPLDEWGNPLPVKEAGFYDVAFPIQGGGTAWGENRVSRAKMTFEDINDHTLGALRRDADWIKRHAMAALLDNVSWAFSDAEHGSLDIEPLANGDTAEYLTTNGQMATDDHYLAQLAAIDDSNNPFDDIYDELTEHAVNAGADIVAYIPTNQKTAVEALTAFYEVTDSELEPGANQTVLAGSIDRGLGDTVLGRVNKVWIVEWKMLPDDYILAVARGASEPPLKMRQHAENSLQGLFTEENSPDGNTQEYRFIRYAGFGSYNRVGALVYQIGSAAYSVPTNYDAPLAA